MGRNVRRGARFSSVLLALVLTAQYGRVDTFGTEVGGAPSDARTV